MKYGHLEHLYAEAFAEAVRTDSAFVQWLLSKTKFAGSRGGHLLFDEMQIKRANPKAPWWKNYFRGSCDCFGCAGGRETDVFLLMRDSELRRFALHVEVKQPTDVFNPNTRQGERYKERAACWAKSAPPKVPDHSDATTILLCSADKFEKFSDEIAHFDCAITFEDIATCFPNATYSPPPQATANADLKINQGKFKIGMRVFHEKFGYGAIAEIEGNKLEIAFEQVGRKRVMDSFVLVG